MMVCAGYVGAVIIIEAGPVYRLFMANIQGKALTVFEWVWILGSFTLVFFLSIAAVMVPMKFGEKRLSEILI
jgi:ABC-2 type transport system permease protein